MQSVSLTSGSQEHVCPSHIALKAQGAAWLCAYKLHVYQLTTPQSKSLLTNQLVASNQL